MESDSRRSEGSDGMSATKFSLLGHGPYGSSVTVVREGQGQSNFSLEGPSPAPMNFSFLLKHYPSQSQSQTQTQQSLPSSSRNFSNNGGGGGRNEVSGDLAISLGGDVQPRHNQLMNHHPMQVYGLGFSENQTCKINIPQKSSSNVNNTASQGFCPQALLNTLSILQQQIQQLQSLVPLIAQQDRKPGPSSSQAFMTASIQSIISQLIAAAAVMLPASQQSCLNLLGISDLTDLQLGQLGQVATAPNSIQPNGADSLDSSVGMNIFNSLDCGGSGATQPQNHAKPASEITEASKVMGTVSAPAPAPASNCRNGDAMLVSQGSAGAGPAPAPADDNDTCGNSKEDDEDVEGESLPPGSYRLVEMDAREILAEHTHFCEICSKGFKRDANLRMHMRGHGDEYKTPAALARPDKPQDSGPIKPRRYSCPFVGCKRNKEHTKFQPLKTMLCVKNHYRRSHCPKMYTCNRCKIKKFSVVADLKTHEKHCGRDKWQCSCGTTFSRKDKLFGHIALFQGHTPAFTSNETEGAVPEQVGNSGVAPGIGDSVSGLGSNSGIGGPSYSATANISSIGSSASGTVMDNGHGQIGVKNMNYSQEGNAHGMSMESSSTRPVFPATASGMMPGSFMLQSLLSNNYMQHHRN